MVTTWENAPFPLGGLVVENLLSRGTLVGRCVDRENLRASGLVGVWEVDML